MKASFKPTKFTKKEWRDNRASACSGSGVGKALDQWQKLFDPKLSQMGLKKCSAALNMADKLDKALDVAKKKCNAKRQKESIAGISKYSKIVNHYKAALLKAIFKANNRDKYIESLDDVKDLEKDSALWKLYGKFSKTGKGMFYPQYDTYNLIKKNKIAEAIKKYGNKGSKNNEYNFYGAYKKRCLNDYLYSHYVLKVDEDAKILKRAVADLEHLVNADVKNRAFLAQFLQYDVFLRYVDSKFQIADYK